MKLFLHLPSKIRIIHEDLEWSGTPEDFQTLEPLYPGLPSGSVVRYQTEDIRYYEDEYGVLHTDPVDCLGYCENVSTYLVTGCVWVHVSMDTALLNVNEAEAEIEFSAHIKASADPTDPDLPVSQAWIIRPWHETGARDALLIEFVSGACSYSYTYREGLPLGDWFIREEDFSTIVVGEIVYRVKLAGAVKFTLYRNL